MKRYSKYKHSGIEWIGEIPTHWTVKKLGYVASSHNGDRGVNYPSGDDMVDEGIPFISTSELVNGKIILDNVSYITEEKYQQLGGLKIQENDIIYCLRGSVGKNGRTDFNGGTIASSLMGIRSKKVNPCYLSYLLNSPVEEQQRNYLTTGSVSANLSAENVMRFLFALPPLEEQEAIIDYLDTKTSSIDTLIADKKKLIDLLKEKRQAIISEAVTKGLDKTAKMKDSGIEWIGEVPERWKVTKIKYNTYVKGRIGWQGLKSDEFIDEGAYLVTGTDIMNGRICWDTCYHIGDERYNEAPEIQLKNEDLLITKDGTIGKVAIVKDMPYKAILNSGLFVTRPLEDAYSTSYMYWLLNSKVFWDYFGYLETGSTIKHLYQETFENFSFPLPPVDEQTGIVFYLDQKTFGIDSLITDITSQIEKLKEYRQSIISEAVTGKVAL